MPVPRFAFWIVMDSAAVEVTTVVPTLSTAVESSAVAVDLVPAKLSPPSESVFMRSTVTSISSTFVLPARMFAEYVPSRTFTSLNAVLFAILSTSNINASTSS